MSDVVQKNWSGLLTTGLDGRLYSNPNAAPGGRFFVDNPVASPIALTRFYPLSQAEIEELAASGSAHWYQSAAVAGIPWRLPLGFMGGTYPFDYALEGPEGAEIVYQGRDELVPPFMEYIEWANPTMGTHEFTVTCIDQEDTEITVSFTLEVYDEDDTDNVGWVNPDIGDDLNDGSRAEPWATINGWYGGSEGSSTHRNKIILYEDTGEVPTPLNIGGVAGVSYDGANGQRCNLVDAKPKCHIAVGDVELEGNGAAWDMQGGVGWTFAGPFIHSDVLFDDGGGAQRIQWFRCGNNNGRYGFIGMGYTATGGTFAISEGSNSSFIEYPDAGTPVAGRFLPGLIVDDVQTTGETWAVLKNNNAHGVLCVGWECSNLDNVIIFHQKGRSIQQTEERGCIAIDTNTNCQFRNVQWITSPTDRYLNTYCWNNYDTASSPPDDGGGTFLQGGGADNYEDQAGWRNNERVAFHRVQSDTGTFTLTRNARVHSGAFTDGVEDDGDTTIIDGAAGDEYTSTTAGDLDATTNLLAGAARAAELGLVGCEMTVVS